MRHFPLGELLLSLVFVLAFDPSLGACTNLIVTKGASADGSVICTYNCDTFGYSGWLTHSPAGRHEKGEKIPIRSFWHPDGIKGYVEQVEYTYNVIGYINEKQLCIVETTFGGRHELVNPEGILGYDNVIQLALQRCSTARDAIHVMGELMAEYGYNDEGETFTVCDKDEAWIMEIVGKGLGRKGAVWVALRIPDGSISAHANISRIRQFPQVAKAKKNSLYQEIEGECMYSSDVISFAREMGFFSGEDKDFSFRDAYCPIEFIKVRQCDARVWSFFRHHTDPSEMDKYMPYIDGKFDVCDHLPLWITPDKKLSVRDIMADMRDHYEGTPLDMTRDIDAGPWGMPVRPRAKTFESNGQKYFRERPIASPQAGFTLVSQLRGWLPDEVGGIMYFNCDDADMIAYVPVYCCESEIPVAFREENNLNGVFNENGAYWFCNMVSNFIYPRYSALIGDLRAAQKELEDSFCSEQETIDSRAKDMTPSDRVSFLTAKTGEYVERMMSRWNSLWKELIVKYNDQPGGYGQRFYDAVARDTGDRYKIPE
jgi:dipeptidase